jgi:hypothetical protein
MYPKTLRSCKFGRPGRIFLAEASENPQTEFTVSTNIDHQPTFIKLD